MKNKIITVLFLTLLFSSNLEAAIKLPALISDGMVLQCERSIEVWGWASPKESINIKFLGKNYKTKASNKGEWSLTLPAQKSGTQCDIHINNCIIKDVIFGDVWLCSGQSNMELPIKRVLDLYANEIKDVKNSDIRYFRVPMKYNFREEEVNVSKGKWENVTPETVLNFSAVAYFFAQELYKKYDIPIGIINTAIGGSPAEAWISSNTLKKHPSFYEEAKKYAKPKYIENIKKEEQEKSNKWHQEMIQKDKGIGLWNQENTPLTEWNNYSLPGLWKEKKINIKNGVIWFRKEFTLTKEEAKNSAILRMGYIIDSDSTFLNGKFVGTTGYQYPPRIYPLPTNLLKEGKNIIAIRIVTNPNGGFVEDKPYKLIFPNREIDLTGDWKYRIGTELPPTPSSTFFQYKPMGLYNGMIAPLNKFNIKGILWYQGESNIARAQEYTALFQDLISDWRKERNEPNLPFIYAQLPELNKPWKKPTESGIAELREAQKKALVLPQTGMAVTLGLGEWNDIHPLDKKEVAHRLALEAQRVAYGDTSTVSSGPILENHKVEGNEIILTFSSVGSGLYTNAVLEGFTIEDSNKKQVWANATVLSNNTVRVWNNQIEKPSFVRYAWADNPQGANLKNKEGLPASSFKLEL